MWGYIVLSALAGLSGPAGPAGLSGSAGLSGPAGMARDSDGRDGGAPMRTQAALARAIGADKTRIIGVLDDLQSRGYIERRPDPSDRRVHLLALTSAGREVHTAVRAAIRREEERLLGELPAGDRAAFLRVLEQLQA
jgi:DNA-binding MarR family transcriptional regulator